MLLIASSFIKTIKDSVAVERHNNNISFDAKFTGFIGVGYLKLVREDKAMILPWLGPNHGSIHIKIATRTGGVDTYNEVLILKGACDVYSVYVSPYSTW